MTSKENRIDVVIPVYNEGGNIENTLKSLRENIQKVNAPDIRFRVVIVYDFDEDDTIPVVKRIENECPFPIVFRHNPERGVLNALKTGLLKSDAHYVLVTMADLSDDYSIFPKLVEYAREGYDVICPSRYMKGGKMHGGPFLKGLLSRIAGVTLHWLCGIRTRDITNSYKMYKRSCLDEIVLESTGGFEIGMEITAKLHKMKKRIVEIPSHWWDRTEGKSRFKLMKWLPKYLKWYFYLVLPKKEKIS